MLTRRTLHSMLTGMGVTLVGVPVAWTNDWRAIPHPQFWGGEQRERSRSHCTL